MFRYAAGKNGLTGLLFVPMTAFAFCAAFSLTAAAEEIKFKEVKIEKYGYSMKIPEMFEMNSEKPDKTTDWMYQPGSTPAGSTTTTTTKKGLKGRLGANLNIGGINLGGAAEQATEQSTGDSSSSSGGLEPALLIYVNWVWMPDVSSQVMFDANKKGDQQNVDSPDPDYKDIEVFSTKKGYAFDGLAYRYKEVDKDKPDEIHRWHVKAYGNNSAYTLGFTGTYEQFEKWGPVYEKVIKSFKLIPLKKEE